MRSFVGFSHHTHPELAITEATRDWPTTCPDLVFIFSSSRQNPDSLRQVLETRYPTALIVGCTSAGESPAGLATSGSVSMAGLYTPRVRWAAELIAPLSEFHAADARHAVFNAFNHLQVDLDLLEPDECIAVLLCDGLSKKEEQVAEAVAEALQGIPVVGGSAGDDMAFKQTYVTGPGYTRNNAAVLLVGHGPAGFFHAIKHQHFEPRGVALAVTRAVPEERRVYEIDGFPAVDAYARALNIAPTQLASAAFLNPVLITIQDIPYIRSVQQVHGDGSLTFYCGVEEGWILDLATHRPMEQALAADLAPLTHSPTPIDFCLGFNCVLRAIEARERGLQKLLAKTLANTAHNALAFETYGEISQGLHINQTLVALALTQAA